MGQASSLGKDLEVYGQKALQEKVFLHIDRPAYACGETMWFKIYVVDGTKHQPLDLSKVAYVEVMDAIQKPVLQGKIALKEGVGSGSFQIPVSLASGNYTVRAYTNWMKNFNSEFFFEQPITIINTFQSLGLTKLRDTASYAIQFFPEGGSLVHGLRSKVAFKTINQFTGKGVFSQGKVVDSNGKVVARFASERAGIGTFAFTPIAGTDYTAVVKCTGGNVVREKLPLPQSMGYTVMVEEQTPGLITVTTQSTNQYPEQLYLLGHARQQVTVAAISIMADGKAMFTIAKDSLAPGINHFTIFNAQRQPVAERLFFKRPTEQLDIQITLNKSQFEVRDKVVIELQARQASNAITDADFSMAVFKADGLQFMSATDIQAYLYLTSDLKGQVENAGTYFTDQSPETDRAIDNLMLTHGWSRFNWQDVISKVEPTFVYLPEYDGHFINVRVTNQTGKPAKDIRTYLASPGKNIRFYSGYTDKDGEIRFEVKDHFGPKDIIVQTNFKKDSIYKFEVLSPFFEKQAKSNNLPFWVGDTLRAAIYDRHLGVQAQHIYFEKYLNQFRTLGIDSLAFYGKPTQQFRLDDFTRFKVMEEVMREYVPTVMVRKRKDGYHFRVMDEQNKLFFQEDPTVLIDGVPVFDINKVIAFDPLKIQKLDVMAVNYYTGSLVSYGIVSYTTYKGDLADFPIDTRALLQEYEGLQRQREFYSPDYDSQEQKLGRLPDWRNLLYWSPDVKTDLNGKANTHFFTSDQAGTYFVVIQGLSKSGIPGARVVSFKVRKPL